MPQSASQRQKEYITRSKACDAKKYLENERARKKRKLDQLKECDKSGYNNFIKNDRDGERNVKDNFQSSNATSPDDSFKSKQPLGRSVAKAKRNLAHISSKKISAEINVTFIQNIGL